MVTTFYPPHSFGGDAIFVQRLANELAERGHSVDVIHCVDAYRALGGRAEGAGVNHPGVRVHGLRSSAGLLWPLAMQQTGGPAFGAARLRQLLEADYDVIHFHNVSLMGAPEILTYGTALKIYTMHEFWLVCPMHVLTRADGTPCESQECFSCSLAHGRPPQLWRYTDKLKRALAHVDLFLALSTFSLERHRRDGLTVNLKLIGPFAPRPLGPTSSGQRPTRPYVLYAGRLEKIKGVQDLITAFAPDLNADLLIAGTGSLDAELRERAAGDPRIQFLGHVRDPQLTELFRGATAAVVPSTCYEVAPLVILEAFRVGTPVVARRIGGMPELVESSGGGLVFENVEGLEAGLRSLIADPSAGERLGQRALAAYEQRWTPEAHLASYFSMIGELREQA